jgi:hypothetical protein
LDDLYVCQSSSVAANYLKKEILTSFEFTGGTDNLTFVKKSDKLWMCKKQGNS